MKHEQKEIYNNASLLRKGLLGTATDDERRQLEKLLEKQSVKEAYEQLSDPAYLKTQFDEYKKYSGEKAFREFLSRVGRRKRFSPLYLWGYAAATVAVVVLTVILWEAIPGGRSIEPAKTENIVRTGSKRATLTLADGRTVEVSTENVSVREKNGAKINYSGGTLSYNTPTDETEMIYNELNVPMGGESSLVLSDGTKVWLNAGTRLRYPVHFAQAHREVYLEGEAFFEVVKSRKPFIVETAFGKIDVLGTAFGVYAFSAEEKCRTTLVSGKVSFSAEGRKPLEITPGEQVTATKTGLMEKQKVNPDEYVGWKDGIYVFREKSLEDIMKTIERWYDISVSFRQPELRYIPFTGSFKRGESVNAFLDALSRTRDLQYSFDGNNLTLFK